MDKTIVVEPLQKQFVVSVKDANKASRNRSYSTASNCCGSKLSQEMKCSSCDAVVQRRDCSRKIVKIGKEEHLIDANTLKQVQEQLEQMEELKLHTFMKQEPQGAQDRYDGLVYAKPATKKEAHYKELAQILQGRVAIGTAVFRSNEFQVLVTVGDDGVIRIRKMVSESQRYEFSPAQVQEAIANAHVNEQIVEMERQILDKHTKDSFDVTQFEDTRTEIEEKIIEDYVLHGKEPEVPKQVMEQQQDNELERLKALMEG